MSDLQIGDKLRFPDDTEWVFLTYGDDLAILGNLSTMNVNIVFDHEDDPPHDWIFTFGFGHYGGRLRNYFVRINGTFHEARAEMVRCFGQQWSHQYESEKAAGVPEFNLKEIK
jgi:hypothetical protein